MKLTVLVDNNTNMGNWLIAEHGLSFYIEDSDVKLIFDCGSTDAFIKNSYKMSIDLEQVTDIVLSHSHDDHIGGFMKLQMLYQKLEDIGIKFGLKNVMAHPDVFKQCEFKNAAFGEENIRLDENSIAEFFNLILTREPRKITPKLYYLGEIPANKDIKNDYAADETALAYKSKDGLVVISGCSHSGVENIIEHAKKITGESYINTLIGGIYLINREPEEVHELGKYLQAQDIKKIYPCHCTDLESKIILSRYVNIGEVSVGRSYSWDSEVLAV